PGGSRAENRKEILDPHRIRLPPFLVRGIQDRADLLGIQGAGQTRLGNRSAGHGSGLAFAALAGTGWLAARAAGGPKNCGLSSARTEGQRVGGRRLGRLSRVVGEGAAGAWLATLGQPKSRHGFDFGMGTVRST